MEFGHHGGFLPLLPKRQELIGGGSLSSSSTIASQERFDDSCILFGEIFDHGGHVTEDFAAESASLKCGGVASHVDLQLLGQHIEIVYIGDSLLLLRWHIDILGECQKCSYTMLSCDDLELRSIFKPVEYCEKFLQFVGYLFVTPHKGVD